MDKIDVTQENRSTFEQNKREMFDGMRAYHVSEHQHKRDAVNFLRSILGIAAGIYGVIISTFFTELVSVGNPIPLVWVILFFIGLVVFLVVNSTNKKIEANHEVYKVYGDEYTRFCFMLELNKSVDVSSRVIDGKRIDLDDPIGQGDGYKKTMYIISEWGWAVVIVAAILTLVVTFMKS